MGLMRGKSGLLGEELDFVGVLKSRDQHLRHTSNQKQIVAGSDCRLGVIRGGVGGKAGC